MTEVNAAEARVRAFRDAVADAAARLERPDPIALAELVGRLRAAHDTVEDDDLGADADTIRTQFAAMFDRLDALAAEHPEPVATDALGLPADARFLSDMADFLTRRYGLEDEDE